MNLIDNKRLFQLTPVVDGIPPTREPKYPFIPVNQIYTLGEYIVVPPNMQVDIDGYVGRKVFQFNVSFGEDLYITNAPEIARFGTMNLLGGCIMIKWRFGCTNINGINYSNVFRYRLMDSHGLNDNWSGVPFYTNQLIKANFCLEFWQDNTQLTRGISQQFLIKTNNIVVPVDTNQDNSFISIPAPKNIPDLRIPFTIFFPMNNSNEAFADNLI